MRNEVRRQLRNSEELLHQDNQFRTQLENALQERNCTFTPVTTVSIVAETAEKD